MAMTVRFPPEFDAAIQRIAESQHTSKHALVLRGMQEFIAREEKTAMVLGSLDETSRDYAEMIKRLEDS